MEGRQYISVVCCLLVAIFSTFCHSQSWRPQGRFGKRLSPSHISAEAETSRLPGFESSNLHEIPVELFYSEKEVAHMRTKPRLCSVSGLRGYPTCDSLASSRRDTEDFSKYFDM